MKLDKDFFLKVVVFPFLAGFLSAVAHEMQDGIFTMHDLYVALQTAFALIVGVFIHRPGTKE